MKIALREIQECWQSMPVALHFAWGDTRARYRRSMLGPFWIVLTTAIGVAGLGVLWSTLLKSDKATFIPSLTAGLVVWQLISACVTESPSVFLRNAVLIRNIKTPFLMFPVQMILRQLINFLHNAVVIVVVLCIYPPAMAGVIPLLAIPGLVLVVLNMLWIALLVGMMGARYRDLEPLIVAVMPMLFFLSPVIYRPDHALIAANIIWLNPFTYLISAIRDPLLGIIPDMFVYTALLGMMIVGWGMALWALSRFHRRIAFWV
jgi:ABC-type polysaccharide/polyol phosphate export permease